MPNAKGRLQGEHRRHIVVRFAIYPVESQIMSIRGKQIMIDRDLAELYGVETRVLNQAVKRNMERFPDFRIRINPYTKDFTPIEKTLQEYDRLGITIY